MTQLRLLSARDAGARLGVTSSGVRRIADAGELPFVRDSTGRRLFDRRDVLALVKRRARRARARGAGPEAVRTGS